MKEGMTSPDDRLIILLDLNYTLVANNPPRGTTPPRMEKRLKEERYRQWLVELIRPHHVILITARPDRWKKATLARIATSTGWSPDAAYFAPAGASYPPRIKKHLLLDKILPSLASRTVVVAIERNPKTRQMYGAFGIACLCVSENGAGVNAEA
jgi:hypothetical protein